MRLARPVLALASVAAAITSTVTWTSVSRAADSADEKAADALFQSARAAMDRGDLAAACPRFAESQRLDPAPGTLLNLGECEARAGTVASALQHYRAGRVGLAAKDFRLAFADERIAELEGRVPRLAVRPASGTSSVAGILLSCDGVVVAPSSFGVAAPVDPGVHACVLVAAGHAASRFEVTLAERESRAVDVPLGPSETPASSVAVAPSPVASAAPPRSMAPPPPGSAPTIAGPSASAGATQRAVGSLVGSVGVIGITVGALFAVLAKGTYDGATAQCTSVPSGCTSDAVHDGAIAHDQAAVATVAFIAGGALVAGGVILVLTAPRALRVQVAPAVGARGGWVGVGGAW